MSTLNLVKSKDRIQQKLDLVVQRLTALDSVDGSEYEKLPLEEQQRIGYFSRDFGMGHWDWPQGVGLLGLSQFDGKYDDYIKNWAVEEINKGLPLANINTVCPLLTLMDYPQYEELCLEWIEEILAGFDRTEENGLQHNTTGHTKYELAKKNQQLWADTIFMTVLFVAKMGKKYQKQEWLDAATYQVLLHLKYLFNTTSGLFYHGWDFTTRDNFGANFWCRGNSWLTLGIPLFIDYMGESLQDSVKDYLVGIYQNQVKALVHHRDESGLWHTIIDDSSSYLETSGSAGIIAGMYYGISKGYINYDEYLPVCDSSIEALLQTIDENGTVQGVSAGTNISKNREDYKNIIIQPMAYGQALMICALGQSILL